MGESAPEPESRQWRVEPRILFWIGFGFGALEILALWGIGYRWWDQLPSRVLGVTGILGPFGAVGIFVGSFSIPVSLPRQLFRAYQLTACGVGAVLNGLLYRAAGRALAWSATKHRALHAAVAATIALYFVAGFWKYVLPPDP